MSVIDRAKEELRDLLEKQGDISIIGSSNRVYKISEVLDELGKEEGELVSVYNISEEHLEKNFVLKNIEEMIENVMNSPFKDVTKPQKILMTRPRYEEATQNLYKWEEPLLGEIKKRGIPVTVLDGPEDTRENFERGLKDADTVFIFGHGNSSAIAGHNNEIILDPKNIELLKGKNVLVMACMSARLLGVIAVAEGGANFYYGYKRTFLFMLPPYGEPFEDAGMWPFYKFLDGGSLEKILIEHYMKYFIELAGIRLDVFYSSAPILLWDLAALEVRNPL